MNGADIAAKTLKDGGMVDGRTLRLEIVEDRPGGGGPRSAQRSLLTTGQSTRDLALKCYNCSKTGHIAADCPRPAAVSMCSLCGKVRESESRSDLLRWRVFKLKDRTGAPVRTISANDFENVPNAVNVTPL